jgi:aconitate hydratase 2/2-methylisocitrate dehydratase
MDPDFLGDYQKSVIERSLKNLPPLGLSSQQILKLITRLQDPLHGEEAFLKQLLLYHVPNGNHEATRLKARFLSDIATSKLKTPLLTPSEAISALGVMQSPYSITALVELLDYPEQAPLVVEILVSTVLLFEAYYDVLDKYEAGNPFAEQLLNQWSHASWLYKKPALPESIKAVVFKVTGKVTADMLSPMSEAWNRSDIAVHAQSLLKAHMPNTVEKIQQLKQKGYPLIFVCEEIETTHARAALRQAGLNSLIWHFGEQIPYAPNQVHRGLILSQKIDPCFYTAAEDKGVCIMEGHTAPLQMGQIIHIYPFRKQIHHKKEKLDITLKPDAIESWRAGGRVFWRLGRLLTSKACTDLKQAIFSFSSNIIQTANTSPSYSLAQKLIGYACGVPGVLPGVYCEPRISVIDGKSMRSISSDDLKGLPHSGISVDCMVYPFRHQALDSIQTHIQLKPGDGIVNPWLNHMLLPFEVMLSEDAYTRASLGVSLLANASQLADATLTGSISMIMPESVRVRFYGQLQPGITLQDLVYAIPYIAKKNQDIDIQDEGNIFADRIIEIEGLSNLTAEQASLFIETAPDRGAIACIVDLKATRLKDHILKSLEVLHGMINKGYRSPHALKRRIKMMEAWLLQPQLFKADENAQYAITLDINLNEIKEPFIADFQNPDKIWRLSEVNEMPEIENIFVGPSGMQFNDYQGVSQIIKKLPHSLPTRVWITPSNKLESKALMSLGVYAIYSQAGARTDMPDHTLCLGNRLKDNMTFVSTSRHHFSSQRAKNIKGYLVSPILAAIIARLGRFPTDAEYKSLYSELTERSVYAV